MSSRVMLIVVCISNFVSSSSDLFLLFSLFLTCFSAFFTQSRFRLDDDIGTRRPGQWSVVVFPEASLKLLAFFHADVLRWQLFR